VSPWYRCARRRTGVKIAAGAARDVAALHMMPSIRGRHFTVSITGGQLGPNQSVTTASPNQAPGAADSIGPN
jgi:hypothetical protein